EQQDPLQYTAAARRGNSAAAPVGRRRRQERRAEKARGRKARRLCACREGQQRVEPAVKSASRAGCTPTRLRRLRLPRFCGQPVPRRQKKRGLGVLRKNPAIISPPPWKNGSPARP